MVKIIVYFEITFHLPKYSLKQYAIEWVCCSMYICAMTFPALYPNTYLQNGLYVYVYVYVRTYVPYVCSVKPVCKDECAMLGWGL